MDERVGLARISQKRDLGPCRDLRYKTRRHQLENVSPRWECERWRTDLECLLRSEGRWLVLDEDAGDLVAYT